MFKKRVFSAGLAALLLLPLFCTAFAQQPPTLRPCRLVCNDRTEEGNLLPTYMVDADGNVLPSPQAETVEAAAESFPAKYDLRDAGVVTSVKNQAGAWNCWAFAATSCMEISYIRQGLGTAANTDFAEAHLIWFGHRGRVDDHNDPTWGDGLYYSNPFMNGGGWEEAASTIMRGSGMQLESNARWIDSYLPSVLMGMAQKESDRYVSHARLWQAMQIPESQLSITTIKSRIIEYGGIEIYYYDDFNFGNRAFNDTFHSYYQTEKVKESNHAVTLIGWDDTFPRTNFNKPAPFDGAWLVKGSWSEGYGNSGYCWLSYCDPSIMKCSSFIAAPADIYDNIYQYDGAYPTMGFPVESTAKEANLFTARKAETLTHVGVFSPNEQTMTISVRIYVDDGSFKLENNDPTNGMRLVPEATTTIRDMEYGYRTIPLNRTVDLQAGQKFTVEVTFAEPSLGNFYLPLEGYTIAEPLEGQFTYGGNPGESFVYVWGNWDDTNQSKLSGSITDYNNVPIKAMTKDRDAYEPTLVVQTQPTKKEYYVGDSLNTTGLTLLYTDSKGKAHTITSGYQCEPVSLTEEGAREITVSYAGVQTSFRVQVNPVVFSLSPGSLSLRIGQTKQLSPQIRPSSMQTRWTSDDLSIATVSETGAVHAVGEGETTVRGIAEYSGRQYDVSCKIYVTDPEVRALRTNIAQTLYEGDTLRIPSIDVIYVDGSTSKMTEGFDYSPKSLDNAGTQDITLIFGKWTDTYTVQVQPLSLTLDRQQLSFLVGQTSQLSVTARPTGLKTNWSTSNAAVAEVSADGTVRARAAGDAIISATIVNGTKQCSATCNVHVAPMPTLRIRRPSTTTLKYGQSLTLHAETENLPSGVRVLWTQGSDLSNRSGQGSMTYTVEAKTSGTVTVTAYLADSSGNLVCDASGAPITAYQQITMRCGLLQKIGSFFRKLFGVRTHYSDDITDW